MPTKPQRSVRIPVKVESSKPAPRTVISSTKHAMVHSSTPPGHRRDRAGGGEHSVVKSSQLNSVPSAVRKNISDLPVEQRRRWMWGFVAMGSLVAVLLWGLSLGSQLRPQTNETTIFSKVADLFHGFRLTNSTPVTPKQQEIQKLEKQVFPQFE